MRQKTLFRWIGILLLFLLVGGEGFLHPLFHCSGPSAAVAAAGHGADVLSDCGHDDSDAGLVSAPCLICAGVLHAALAPEIPAAVDAELPEAGCDRPVDSLYCSVILPSRARAPPAA